VKEDIKQMKSPEPYKAQKDPIMKVQMEKIA
jgi:hypothetical protein